MTDGQKQQTTAYLDRFRAYFESEIAEKAAAPLANSAEIEFQVGDGPTGAEVFTFHREGGKNWVRPGPASDQQITFHLTPKAADEVLADPSGDIGSLGVGILKLIVTPDASRKVSFKLKAGILTLWNKGYFGVITAGGAPFAAFLASKGLNGIGAIKEALKKAKG